MTLVLQLPIMAYFTGKAIKTSRLKLCVILYTVLCIPFQLILVKYPQIQWVVLFLYSILFFLLFSEVSKRFTVFYYIMGIALMMLVEMVLEVLVWAIYPKLIDMMFNDPVVVLTMLFVMNPLLILVWYMNTKICNRIFHLEDSKEFDKYISFILVEAVALYALYINVIRLDKQYRLSAEIVVGIALCVFLILDLLLIRTLRKMDQIHKMEIQERTSREILQLQMENYQFQYDKTREFRMIRHDLINHLQTLQLFLDNQELDHAKELIKNYSEDLKVAGRITITGNEFADMIIAKKQDRAEREDIDLQIEGTLPKNLTINPASFCSLIENLLDNAINGCLNSNKKEQKIVFKVAADQNKLMLKCENTCSDDSVAPSGEKREKGDHGWGTQIIESIVERYGGAVDYQVDHGEFRTSLYCFTDHMA